MALAVHRRASTRPRADALVASLSVPRAVELGFPRSCRVRLGSGSPRGTAMSVAVTPALEVARWLRLRRPAHTPDGLHETNGQSLEAQSRAHVMAPGSWLSIGYRSTSGRRWGVDELVGAIARRRAGGCVGAASGWTGARGRERRRWRRMVHRSDLPFSYRGDTALHGGRCGLRSGLARESVTAGASVGAANRRGAEPLHYAVDGNPDFATRGPGRAA